MKTPILWSKVDKDFSISKKIVFGLFGKKNVKHDSKN